MKAAFIFIAPDVDPSRDRAEVKTPGVDLVSVAVNNYAEAVSVARQLVEEGVEAIELCGGFGHVGAGRVAAAVEGKARVGVVRFDGHPGLENKSGDDLF